MLDLHLVMLRSKSLVLMIDQKVLRPRFKVDFNWKIAVCLLVLFTTLVRMGFWQLDRAKQKRDLEIVRRQKSLADPVPIENLILDDTSVLRHKKVLLIGHYDNNRSVFVSNQFYQNQPGYEVITAFKLDASDHVVFVSRGWMPVHQDMNQLPPIEPVPGKQQLSGEIHVPSTNSFFAQQILDRESSWPLRVNHFDISTVSPLFTNPVLPFVVRLGQANPGTFIQHWQEKKHKPTNSTSYAIQWFGMALIVVVITLIKSTNILEIIRSKQPNQ